MIILIFVVITGAFINYRYMSGFTELLSGQSDKPTISMDKVDHVATKDGVRQWSLKASVVNYYENMNRADFKEPVVYFFSENEEETCLTADIGTLDTKTSEITVAGNVEVVNGLYRITSGELHYSDSNRMVTSRVPVRIVESGSVVTADRMETSLDTGITVLEGNVKGKLRGRFADKTE